MAAQDDLERFNAFADEMDFDDETRQNFVNSSMKRKGHKPVMTWADNDDDGDGDDGDSDFFTSKRKSRETRGGGKRESRGNGDRESRGNKNWHYGA